MGNHRPDPSAVSACHQVWVGDVTYIKRRDQYVFLAAVMDLYSREIVGWYLSRNKGAQLTGGALNRAIHRHRPPAGVIFHSDQGIEYANYPFASLLARHGFIQSMSRRGNCYDNAHMESFFHSLKGECLRHSRFESLDEVRAAVFTYIEGFYNTRRIHSSLGYLSPREYASKDAKQR